MASTSVSTSSSPHEVFLNHRGPDLKNTFVSHLRRRLKSCGLSVFLDRDELQEGHDVFSQIKNAICGASVNIAIFSPRYAESPWCLEELVLMKNSETTILPVFHKVDPHVVRHALKDYAEALRKLEEKRTADPQTGEEKPRYGYDTIQNWRKALNYVGNLKGFTHGDDDDEAQLVEDVVERVLGIVPKPLLDVTVYPTGLDEKLEDFENTVLSQAQQDENRVEAKSVAIAGIGGSVAETSVAKKAKVVAIVGMGGAGKTTPHPSQKILQLQAIKL